MLKVGIIFSISLLFLSLGTHIMATEEQSCSRRELSGNTQFAGVPPDKSVLCYDTLQNIHRNHPHNHGRRWCKQPPNVPHEALCLVPMRWCSFAMAMMPHHNIRVFCGLFTPSTSSKIIYTCSGGISPSHKEEGAGRKASCGVLGEHFCQWRARSTVVDMVIVGRWRRVMSDLFFPTQTHYIFDN